MQGIYIAEGREIAYTPVSAVVAGKVIVQANLVGIAKTAIAAAELGALSVSGLFDVDQAAEIIPAGAPVYWDADGNSVAGVAGAGAATATATGNTFMGFAQALTAAADSYVRIALRSAETVAGGVATATSITGTASTLPIAGLTAAQGGTATVTGGTSSTAVNAGGAVALTGGTPGVTGVGGAATVAGGIGGATSGTGGAVVVAGGAGTNGNANGGAVAVRGGNANGSGTDGVVNIGVTNTSAINIGAASIATAVAGPLTASIGASVAAAGATSADAGALPAGTGTVYPTSAADDTRGVIIDAADKVTGRMLFIGNGVANKVLKVYGPSGAAINGAAPDAAFSSASGKGVLIVCLSSSGNTWLAL